MCVCVCVRAVHVHVYMCCICAVWKYFCQFVCLYQIPTETLFWACLWRVALLLPPPKKQLKVYAKVMNVNYWGYVHIAMRALPYMQRTESSHIIVVSSFYGKIVAPYQAGYCASKHALEVRAIHCFHLHQQRTCFEREKRERECVCACVCGSLTVSFFGLS